jgi:hypothetical protein
MNSSPLSALSSFQGLAMSISEALARSEAHAKATHSRFNLFSTLLKESDEVRLHTRFLHCLLDPHGSHDCGSLFLDLFFDTLVELGVGNPVGEEVPFAAPARGLTWAVAKEAARSPHGQIDLLLEAPRLGIAIENKIHAGEQPAQLANYGDYLRNRHGESFHLIYLTLDGKAANSAADHGYFRISYQHHLLHWLEACLRETYRVIPVNQAIIQYRAIVRRLTRQPLEHEFMEPVLDYIRSHPNILRHRQIISQAAGEVRAEVLDQFAVALIRGVEDFTGGAELNPHLEEGRFGVARMGSLLITPHPTSVLRAFDFHIWIEIWDEQLLLGMKVPPGIHREDPETQQVIFRMNSLMNEDAERAESRQSDPKNKAWPAGWDRPVNPLNDEVIAGWLQDGFESEVSRVCEGIHSHIRLLERAYVTARAELSDVSTTNS